MCRSCRTVMFFTCFQEVKKWNIELKRFKKSGRVNMNKTGTEVCLETCQTPVMGHFRETSDQLNC